LNSALAMKIALLTLGVGLIAATAAYMAWLASTTRDAASAQADYNAELARTPTSSKNIRRSGEDATYYRRGVEYQ
jgi:flagellar basal body-associated protein FliL